MESKKRVTAVPGESHGAMPLGTSRFGLESEVRDDGIVVLTLEGEVDIYTATEFKGALLDAIAEGHLRIVIDMTAVSFMDSTGLSTLISGEHRLREKGFSLVIVASPRVARLLVMTGLDCVFARFPTLDEAIDAVSRQGK